MDQVSKAVVVSGIVIPLASVLNVVIGIVICIICLYVVKYWWSRFLRQTIKVDEAISHQKLDEWVAKVKGSKTSKTKE